MTKIELDNLRISKYQELKNNLEAVKEFFRHGDILIKQVNNTLEETRNTIDTNGETSFTKDDFNDMLDLRNEVLSPIFQNASFAKEFEKYVDGIEEPIVSIPAVITEVTYEKSNGELIRAIVVEKLNEEILKTTTLIYSSGKLLVSEILEGNTTKISKFLDGVLITENIITEEGNKLEITNNSYENGLLASSEYTKYVNGLKV